MRMRIPTALVLLPLLAGLATPAPAPGQILERLKDQAENELEARLAGLVRCAFDDLACIRSAQEDGEEVALTDGDGQVLTDDGGEPVSDPARARVMVGAETQETGGVVGSIEIQTPGGTRTFQVVEGPPGEGFSTGYNERPVGEAMAFGFSVTGEEEGTDASLLIRSGVFRDSMEQVCDPFSNNVELHAEPGGRLRPGDTGSTTCPGNAVDINVTAASFDEAEGTLHVEGTFSGPLGRGDDAVPVSQGRFEATVRSFQAF